MAVFVIDEWLWADLRGDNGLRKQSESLSFLIKVLEKCDQLVTVEGSPFIKKFYDLCEQADVGDRRRWIVRVFKNGFFHNSKKLRRLHESDLAPLSDDIARTIKGDDYYLVRAYYTANADSLVTADNPLIEVLNEYGINCQDRDSFLSDYTRKD